MSICIEPPGDIMGIVAELGSLVTEVREYRRRLNRCTGIQITHGRSYSSGHAAQIGHSRNPCDDASDRPSVSAPFARCQEPTSPSRRGQAHESVR